MEAHLAVVKRPPHGPPSGEGKPGRRPRKKPGFAGVPSRQEKNPMLCMDFFLGATALRPFNPLRTNRGRYANGSPWLRSPCWLGTLCRLNQGSSRDAVGLSRAPSTFRVPLWVNPLRTNRGAASLGGVSAPVGLYLRKTGFRGASCRLTQQHASRAPLGANPLRTNRQAAFANGSPWLRGYFQFGYSQDRVLGCRVA
jgi:hypothetical protein